MTVLVVGQGIVGLTTALVLAERGLDVRVRPVNERPPDPPWWVPVTPEPPARDPPLEGLAHLSRLARVDESGVSLLEARLRPAPASPSWWSKPCGGGSAEPLRAPVPVVDGARHRAWLEARLLDQGATLEERPVHRLWGHAGHRRVVVNAGGPTARRLARDAAVSPAAVASVEVSVPDPPPATLLLEGPPVLVQPTAGGARLVAAVPKGSPGPDRDPEQRLLDHAAGALPSLAGAQVLEASWGRAGRRAGGPRVEAQRLAYGGTVVHSYGHGPLAPARAWAVRERVADLVEQALAR